MAALTVAAVAVLSGSAPARAEDIILAGPHPFLKANALSAQFLLSAGFGDTFRGRGAALGYGYMLDGPLWLDLQMNVRASACDPVSACTVPDGSDVQLLVGASWRFRTAVPLVPYLRGAAGPIFVYPRAGENTMGLAARLGAGARYYVYDWLGFGMEAALSVAHDYVRIDTYPVFDLAVGVEWQFR